MYRFARPSWKTSFLAIVLLVLFYWILASVSDTVAILLLFTFIVVLWDQVLGHKNFLQYLDKKLNLGPGEAISVNINMTRAITNNSYLMQIAGIDSKDKKSSKSGLTKTEQEKWRRFCTTNKISEKCWVKVDYIPNIDGFLVSGNYASRGCDKVTIYHQQMKEEADIGDDNVILQIYSKSVRIKDRTIPVLTGIISELNYDESGLSDNNRHSVLFNFPYTESENEELLSSLGFELEHQGSDDLVKDEFGEDVPFPPASTAYRMNDTVIHKSY